MKKIFIAMSLLATSLFASSLAFAETKHPADQRTVDTVISGMTTRGLACVLEGTPKIWPTTETELYLIEVSCQSSTPGFKKFRFSVDLNSGAVDGFRKSNFGTERYYGTIVEGKLELTYEFIPETM